MKKFQKLYLHIGLEKTGTTSIQRALDVHRDKLEPAGYFYPRSTAVGKNVLLAAMFNPGLVNRPVFKAAVERNGGTWPEFYKIMQANLREEYSQTNAENLILSSEFIAVHTKYDRVKAYCDEVADETVVILYLREQAAKLMSLYSTFIKGGGVEFGVLKEVDDGTLPDSLDYASLIKRLEKSFGSALKIRLFEKERLVNENVIHDFLDVVGMSESLDAYDIQRQNESLSLAGTKLLKIVNPHLPILVNGDKSQARDDLMKDISSLDATGLYGKARLSSARVKMIQKLSKAGNDWIRDKYFPDQESLFTMTENADQEELSDQDVLGYSAQLVARAYEQVREKQNVLNQSAPELKKIQNELNRSKPAMNGVEKRLRRNSELRLTAQEKIDKTMPVIDALHGKVENLGPMLEDLQKKLDDVEPLLFALQSNVEYVLPVLESLPLRSKQNNPAKRLAAVIEKLEKSLPLLESLHGRTKNSEPIVSLLRQKLKNSHPMVKSIQEKQTHLEPILQAMQDNLDYSAPIVLEMQRKLGETGPSLNALHEQMITSHKSDK